jgi:predicted RNA methylase
MTRRRGAGFALDGALRDPGFTPRRDDIPALLDRLCGEDEELADLARRALLRVGVDAARAAIARAEGAPIEVVRALTAFVGRAASAHKTGDRGPSSEPEPAAVARTGDDDLRAFLIARLGDEDAKTRSLAASALGKIHHPEAEAALATALAREQAGSARRSIVAALGKIGGHRALEALELAGEQHAGDHEGARASLIERERTRAALMVTRTLEREAPSAFDAARPAPTSMPVTLRCRRGLEEILRGELDPDLAPRFAIDNVAGPRIEAMLTGAPVRLLKARTMLTFGFPLPARKLARGRDGASPDALALTDAVIDALSSPEAARIFTHFTAGAVRYRIAWASGGKRRGAVWRVAEEVSRRRPELVNDPTDSTWQAVVYEGGVLERSAAPSREAHERGPVAIRVELVPRFDDPRFAYRLGDVPAASHPTLAAALVRVAGVREDDVVWDPFVGSAVELCERAILGPYSLLIGSDRDEGALSVARANLAAAGASRVELYARDVMDPPPFKAPPTLVITNPPMGRRVHRSADLAELLDRFIELSAGALAEGGRLVWISPLPERTAQTAIRAGLTSFFSQDVDMGGFNAQIQGFSKPRTRPDPARRRIVRPKPRS